MRELRNKKQGKSSPDRSEILALTSFYLYQLFISFLTRYWPFSTLWLDKMAHYRNRHIKDIMFELERALKKANMPFTVYGVAGNDEFYMLLGKFSRRRTYLTNPKLERFIKKLFNMSDGEVYVRSTKYSVRRILIDRHVVNAKE